MERRWARKWLLPTLISSWGKFEERALASAAHFPLEWVTGEIRMRECFLQRSDEGFSLIPLMA